MKLSLAFVMAGMASMVSAGFVQEKRASASASAKLDVSIIQYALTLENLEAAFYLSGLTKFKPADFVAAGYDVALYKRIVSLYKAEATHVAVLSGALLGQGVPTPCNYTFGYNTVDQFLSVAKVLEGVGISAYLGAAPLITNKQYLTVAGSILAVEARHEAALAVSTGSDGTPSAFDTPLGFSQVYSLAASFIKDCPKTNPKLPVVQFPSLSISSNTTTFISGQPLSLNFTRPAVAKGKKAPVYYAHFLKGLLDTPVVVPANNSVTIPQGMAGRVYVVVNTDKALTDKNTVAGPAFFEATAVA